MIRKARPARSEQLESVTNTLAILRMLKSQPTLRVTEGKKSYELTSNGEVCAIFLPLGTMQAFSGRFTVTSTTVPKIRNTTGVVDFRLLNDQADLYATS